MIQKKANKKRFPLTVRFNVVFNIQLIGLDHKAHLFGVVREAVYCLMHILCAYIQFVCAVFDRERCLQIFTVRNGKDKRFSHRMLAVHDHQEFRVKQLLLIVFV